MKRVFYLFLLIIVWCPVTVVAQTMEVAGVQSGVWEADTILVTGHVQVQEALTVQPGTLVLFDGFYHIVVDKGAAFSALGSVTDSIVFTVADTTGFAQYDTPDGGWDGFQVYGGTIRLDYCVVEYGKASDPNDIEGGAFHVEGGSLDITHSTLRCNFSRDQGGAVYAQDALIRMSTSRMNGNKVYTEDGTYAMYGGGASFLRCDVIMSENEFRGNYGPSCIGGALALDSCAVLLDRSVFFENMAINGGGLYLMRSNDKKCRFSNLLFHDNTAGHFAGGFAVAGASPEVYNVTVTRNHSRGVNCNGVFFYQESSPKFANCIIYGNYPEQGLDFETDTVQMWVWTYEGYAPEFRNSLVEGGLKMIHSGEFIEVFEDVLDVDPLFVDPEDYNFRLSEESPCRDAGKVLTPQDLLEGFDLDGLPRLVNRRVDLGPYEFSPAAVDETPWTAQSFLIGNPLGGDSRVCLWLDAPDVLRVRVCSLDGRLMAEQAPMACAEGRAELPVGPLAERLASGLYLIEVTGQHRRFVLKAVK
ncbi:MAG: right-handed parallel beta-helix repeat-containing protein [Bacteroidales bacterium]|nr:right-handed parallel beta-helix repeat-containing protein [Bacteroidales bacterium]